jgi:hypothetical protein
MTTETLVDDVVAVARIVSADRRNEFEPAVAAVADGHGDRVLAAIALEAIRDVARERGIDLTD